MKKFDKSTKFCRHNFKEEKTAISGSKKFLMLHLEKNETIQWR